MTDYGIGWDDGWDAFDTEERLRDSLDEAEARLAQAEALLRRWQEGWGCEDYPIGLNDDTTNWLAGVLNKAAERDSGRE